MALRYPLCDWCGDEIRGRFATITPGGRWQNGQEIRMEPLTYHTSYEYEGGQQGASEFSCFGHALQLLNVEGDFPTPDAGMEWQLVPASEGHHYEKGGYKSPALGTTPLDELGLPDAIYRRVTGFGVFTVEQAAEMRARGDDKSMTAKQLGKLDAALLERGLLPVGEGSQS
jgi:hypothetical protein